MNKSKNEDRIRKETERMLNKTTINPHPKILNTCFFSLKLQSILTNLFCRNVYLGTPNRGFDTIIFWLVRIEKLSEKNMALRIIENEFNSFAYNSKLTEKESKEKIKEVIKHLKEALK